MVHYNVHVPFDQFRPVLCHSVAQKYIGREGTADTLSEVVPHLHGWGLQEQIGGVRSISLGDRTDSLATIGSVAAYFRAIWLGGCTLRSFEICMKGTFGIYIFWACWILQGLFPKVPQYFILGPDASHSKCPIWCSESMYKVVPLNSAV